MTRHYTTSPHAGQDAKQKADDVHPTPCPGRPGPAHWLCLGLFGFVFWAKSLFSGQKRGKLALFCEKVSARLLSLPEAKRRSHLPGRSTTRCQSQCAILHPFPNLPIPCVLYSLAIYHTQASWAVKRKIDAVLWLIRIMDGCLMDFG